MSVEIPDLRDKIIEIIYEIKDYDMSIEEFKEICNQKSINVDRLITQISLNIENGSNIEFELEQYKEIVKSLQ